MNGFDSKIMNITVPSLMIITCMASILLLFNISGLNVNTNSERYEFSFNYENWHKINKDVSTALLAIITTSAAIIAIGFSINHLTLTKVFESYDSQYINHFFKKHKMITSFKVLMLIIIVSTMLLLIIKSMDPPLQLFFITSLIVWFICALGLFFNSFSQTFRLINKFDMICDLKTDILKDMEDLEI